MDGCFIKTFLGGMLLSVVGRDPNRQMYPLAWAIVEGENKESRKWFVSELKKCVPSTDGGGWTIISDEHKVYYELNNSIFQILLPYITDIIALLNVEYY